MSVPLFIISRDRLSCLQQLLERLSDHDNIVIVDNASTYAPLLDFYSSTDRRVVHLHENLGHHAPWTAGLIPKDECYIVTDPDVVPDENCPRDFIQHLQDIQKSHPEFIKIGLSLRIDDLPDCYVLKEQVIAWENQFWNHPKDSFYKAAVDTTFALYRPNSGPDISPAARTKPPYSARHLSWYSDSLNPTEEEIFYKEHADRAVASWTFNDIFDEALKNRLKG